jgi:hypothetical protein
MAQNLEKEYANDNLKIKVLKHTTTGIKKTIQGKHNFILRHHGFR